MRSRRSRRSGPAFRYSAWDGSQVGFDLDADALLDEMADELMYHGDLNAALRRMLQQGFRDRNGEQLMGMREMMERLRQRRQEELENRDLGGIYDEIAEQLAEVVDQERAGIDRRIEEARQSGDQRRQEIVENLAAERGLELELLPDDLAGKVASLQSYDFMDDAARARFEELMDQLRDQLMQSYFNQMSEGMQNITPEQMARMKDMLAELNQMLEQRERGEEPDFEGFMDRYGDFFPGNPETLDELLEQMAQSMAAMQQLLNSMTPEQRAQLQQLSESLLEDMDFRWQMDELSRNLQQAFPNMNWGQQLDFNGDQPMSMGQMSSVLQTIGELDGLEQMLQNVTQPGQLAEVDIDQARDLLGDDAARSLDRLKELAQMLKDAGLIDQRDGRYELTPKGVRALGQKALGDLFRKMLRDRPGRHEIERSGAGHERTYEHKPYEFGDPFHLNVEQTVRNAITRQGSGTPVRLTPDDFEVERTEVTTRSATVLMLDVSMSMPMRDNFLPAKKVAMALHALDHHAVPARLLRAGLVRTRRPRGEAAAAPGDGLGLRVGHQHAARAAARPPTARASVRHQADHHGHRRRADRPHRTRRGDLPVPAERTRPSSRRSKRCSGAPRPASGSTPSCSTSRRTSRTSCAA